MKYQSTRDSSLRLSFSEAVRASMASDGGLFVPESFPHFALGDFAGTKSFSEIASRWLAPFLEGDELQNELPNLCSAALNFPVPVVPLDETTSLLELFHGPTAAFKDVGARFLAEVLSRLSPPKAGKRTIIVATSGDTGGAVAAAFHRRAGFEVLVLFPKGKVSQRQEKQLTTWGGNVRAFAVRGDFDDCQRIVKSAFADPWWQKTRAPVSANSINLGRLLPQGAYYVSAALELARLGKKSPLVIIPSGNLGNATAAMWAKRTGMPLGHLILAMNSNRAVGDYFTTGTWKGLPTVATLANAMDVGNPSNMERVMALYPLLATMKTELSVINVSDEEIKTAIASGKKRWQQVLCPHTAIGAKAREAFAQKDCLLVATAHAAKFESIVEPIVGKVEIPAVLAALLSRPSHAEEIDPTLEALRNAVERRNH